MKTTTIIPILAALTLASACTKTIEFSGKETASLPVLISQAEADCTLNARLTYSRFFLDNSPFKIIDNASFHAELNGTSVSPNFTHVNQGLYNSDLALHENDTLTLRVIVPDKGELTAGCRIPTRPQISDFTFTPEVTIETYPDYQHPEIIYTNIEGKVKFKFQLHDPAGQNNCYMIRAYLVDAKLKNKHFLNLQVTDNIIFDANTTDDYFDLDITTDYSSGSQVLFTDERINGHNHTISGSIPYLSYDAGNETLFLEITSLSRDTYLYTVTKENQQSGSSIMGFLSEPVRIHSNVKGGLGILGAKASINLQLDINTSDTTTRR